MRSHARGGRPLRSPLALPHVVAATRREKCRARPLHRLCTTAFACHAPVMSAQVIAPHIRRLATYRAVRPCADKVRFTAAMALTHLHPRQHAGAIWDLTPWSNCSALCGGGIQSRVASCTRDGSHVTAAECLKARPLERRQCNSERCPVIGWYASNYSTCSATCGEGIANRSVTCLQDGIAVTDDLCAGEEKPMASKRCALPACASWSVGSWGDCT